MRLTCLRCGRRLESLDQAALAAPAACACGAAPPPGLQLAQRIEPEVALAEQARRHAFWAAGTVRNWGHIAQRLCLLGLLVFPLALAGALLGLLVLFGLRDPQRRYSGHRQAAWAVLAGLLICTGQAAVLRPLWCRWQAAHGHAERLAVADSLRALRRAELLHFAAHSSFAKFSQLPGGGPAPGPYTLYLGPDTFKHARRQGVAVLDQLPVLAQPHLWRDGFVAVAVQQRAPRAPPDVWSINEAGVLLHLAADQLFR
ncbi:MAG: hypothetical protein EOO40_04250 [Deltaproteobacteria bacterium]|nr:MAG: hypothetical protein EOO40_04250 [Deltaproteobacteria bacterium]